MQPTFLSKLWRSLVPSLEREHVHAAQGGTDFSDSLLRRVLDGLKWRRTSDTHRAARGRLIERPQEVAKLTQETLDMLHQASQYHRQRTSKKT